MTLRVRARDDALRVALHVRPSSSGTRVGGSHDGALVVRVVEAAERGRATEAALRALADALAVPRAAVQLVGGATSRRKWVEIDAQGAPGAAARLTARVHALGAG
jgi:uncharacterized protein